MSELEALQAVYDGKASTVPKGILQRLVKQGLIQYVGGRILLTDKGKEALGMDTEPSGFGM